MGPNYEQMIIVKHTKRSIVLGKLVLVVVVFTTMVWIALMTKLVFFPNEPARFIGANIETSVVVPNGRSPFSRSDGSVRMRAWIESKLESGCLVSTQYFIEFVDGSVAKVPGMRISSKGEIKEAIYETSVPLSSPPGAALFYVSDTYNCAIQSQRVDSPKLKFTIGIKPSE